MEEVQREARRRKIELLIVPTAEAIQTVRHNPQDANAILHVKC